MKLSLSYESYAIQRGSPFGNILQSRPKGLSRYFGGSGELRELLSEGLRERLFRKDV